MICYLQETTKKNPNNTEIMLVVGSLLCSERFFYEFFGFSLSSKINISKFQFDRMQDLHAIHFRVCGASWVNIKIIITAVPQDSIVSPLLFSVFMDGLVHLWKPAIYIYTLMIPHFCTNKITNKRESQCSSLSEQRPWKVERLGNQVEGHLRTYKMQSPAII